MKLKMKGMPVMKKSRLFAVLISILTGLLLGLPLVQGQGDNPLYVAIIWHQHQPVYYKDPDTGVYIRPWVRVHATKDYLDMAQTVAKYPDVHVTFNITPSLIRQLDDFAAGAKDLYWVKTEIPAESLTDDDKRFILERFFDANAKIIARFPRYQELSDSRAALGVDDAINAWTTQDFRDLQVLFNLAWMDPDYLTQAPLADLAERGRDFTEADKTTIFDETLRIIKEVIPYHAQLQDSGQIEVTMTPFAHPILPLLADSNLAAVAMPTATLPDQFIYGQDAIAQVELGKQLYEDHFGRPPRGMWPAEGSVAQLVIQMIADAGIQWIATDEEVLARSLPDVEDFTRDSHDTVQQADALYRPYTVTGGRGGQVAILFRDHVISDKVGFEYSNTPGDEAAADLMQRLGNIQTELKAEGSEGPNLVTILLDGENAWEYYDNDGKEFLNSLYQDLSDAENIVTVTPSEYLAMTDTPRPIENLWPGSWINHDFSTWIGEPEENQAWEDLLHTRNALKRAASDLDPETLNKAMELMYIAEGSDWFWWYGADQNSGVDETFDQQFRDYLRQIYGLIGRDAPDFVYVPIIPQTPVVPSREMTTPGKITVDGQVSDDEWSGAAYYDLSDDSSLLNGLYYTFDADNLYLRLDAAPDARLESDDGVVGLYLNVPGNASSNAYTRFEQRGAEPVLGFGAHWLLEFKLVDGAPQFVLSQADGRGNWKEKTTLDDYAAGDNELEAAIPLSAIAPDAAGGDRFYFRVVASQNEHNVAVMPASGPVEAILPEAELTNVVLNEPDPTGDDHGPGSYTYPQDAIFQKGVFDATNFAVAADDDTVTFQVTMAAAPPNGWGAPNGMGVLTVDVYVDTDGPANGARLLLPGRNAVLPPDHAWDVAVWAEGWTPGLYRPGTDGPVEIDGTLDISVNPGQRTVTMKVPRSVLPGDPADWSYAVVIASQDGFPVAGVWRVREVAPQAAQWLIGGGADDSNHTRIMDVIYPEAGVQESLLSDYPSSQDPVGDLGPDDFGQVPVFGVGG